MAENLAQVWRASAQGRTLSRDELRNFDVTAAAQLARSSSLSLRAEGHLMYGLAQIWGARTALLLQDARATDEGIGSAFREYLAALSQPGGAAPDEPGRGPGLLDFDFDELSIPNSLLSDPPSQPDRGAAAHRAAAAAGDLSIDEIMRDGEEAPVDLEPDTVTRSAEEKARLADEIDLDFGDLAPAADAAAGPDPLDFGSELDYSSSPPHTPVGNEDPSVHISGDAEDAGAAAPTKPRRRRGGAAVDAVTTLARRSRPSPRILRDLPRPPVRLQPLVPEYPAYMGADAATERLLDPEVVYAEMKRRRHAETGASDGETGEGDAAMPDAAAPELSSEFDPNADFEPAADLEPLDLDWDHGPEDGDVEVTEEMLAAEQSHAKQVLKTQLGQRGQSAQFDELATGAQARATMLMEVLAMAAKGRLRPHQSEAFGPIRLTKV